MTRYLFWEGATIMIKQHVVQRIVKASLALIALGVMLNAETALAQFRHQKGQMCSDLVNAKGVKGDARKAEFKKCMMDPQSYK
jgi:hypothetical protein